MGCDHLTRDHRDYQIISIHAPAWGATLLLRDRHRRRKFQSTHPHGVRQRILLRYIGAVDISIHAPAWGATRFRPPFDTKYLLFQSTHPHGVRPSLRHLQRHQAPISIHAPAWGATEAEARKLLNARISIHAPAWGATSQGFSSRVGISYFNPRTRMGCDTAFYSIPKSTSKFQSTHPHGVRQAVTSTYTISSKISIHAPAWGATYDNVAKVVCDALFQSTHPHGVRPIHSARGGARG